MATLDFTPILTGFAFETQNATITNNTPGPITIAAAGGAPANVIPAGGNAVISYKVASVNYNAGIYYPQHNFMGSNNRPVAVTYALVGNFITFTW